MQTFSTRKWIINSGLSKLKIQEEKHALYFLWEEEKGTKDIHMAWKLDQWSLEWDVHTPRGVQDKSLRYGKKVLFVPLISKIK